MPGKVIEIVEGMLGKAEEVLSFLFLQCIGLDGDAQRKDRTTSLYIIWGDGMSASGPSFHTD